ncbi:MAG: class I SAM-dependent methyltransferase [Deltaproteobacteria bacterium]|jgi:SAM-dependent methyltransferase
MVEPTQSEAKDKPDERWVMMLKEYLLPYGIRLTENPNILNIGCGNSVTWNYLALTFYLADLDLGKPNYTGIDVEEAAFDEAKKALEGLVHFVRGDAQHLMDLVTGPYELIVVEHPNLTTSRQGPKIWRRIFEETAKVLDDDGGLILTSFWLNDHIPAQVALGRAGFRVLFSGRNKYPGKTFDRAQNGERLAFDKYVLIAKKGNSGQGPEENS